LFKGLTANVPLLRVGGNEVSYHFDPKSDFVTVNCKVHGRSAEIKFRTLSGDWLDRRLRRVGVRGEGSGATGTLWVLGS
jgi:hypothetical protein